MPPPELPDNQLDNLTLCPILTEEDPLYDLWKTFWNQPVNANSENDVLPLTTTALADTDYRLYVFSQYKYMYHRVTTFIDRVRTDDVRKRPPAVAIIGTPGIGKTRFLEYFLALELTKGKPVIMFTGTASTLYIFTSKGVYIIDTAKATFRFNRRIYQGLLALIDVDLGNLPGHILESNMHIIQAASPLVGHTKWLKQRPGSVTYVMNPPSFEELCTALRLHDGLSDVSKGQISRAVADYGFNIRKLREVLESLLTSGYPEIDLEVDVVIKTLRSDVLSGLVHYQIPRDVTHQLVTTRCYSQPSSTDPGYTRSDKYQHFISSRAIWLLCLQEYTLQRFTEMTKMLEKLSFIPEAGSTAGVIFEVWCHRSIVAGDLPIQLTPMRAEGSRLVRGDPQTTSSLDVKVDSMKARLFNQKELLKSTLDTNVYFIPSASNNPTYDAFFRPDKDVGLGLQMTLATTHSLSTKGLRMLLGRLRDCSQKRFVFVIPRNNDFSCPKPSMTYMKYFKFYTLEVDVSKHVAFQSPCEELDVDAEYSLPEDDVMDIDEVA